MTRSRGMLKQTQGGGVKVYIIIIVVDDDREILIERLDPCVAKIAKISCMTEDRQFITPSCTSSSPHHLITSLLHHLQMCGYLIITVILCQYVK